MANAKVCIAPGTLNRQWWDEAKEKIAHANYGVLNDYDRQFCDDINNKEKDCAENGFDFAPTVKQFNYLRQIASRL